MESQKKPKKYSATESAMRQYPVINVIKDRLRSHPEISEDQVRGYCRRVMNSKLLEIHVALIDTFHRSKNQRLEKMKELRREKEALENTLKIRENKYEKARQRCIEEFGEKSYEYEKIFAFQPPKKQEDVYPEVAKK